MPTLQWLNREEALGGASAAPYRLLVEEAALSAVGGGTGKTRRRAAMAGA